MLMKKEVSRTDEAPIICHDPDFTNSYRRSQHRKMRINLKEDNHRQKQHTMRSLHRKEQFTQCALWLESSQLKFFLN
jgi:hypothetical protein